jgi:hypothetical protein
MGQNIGEILVAIDEYARRTGKSGDASAATEPAAGAAP